MRLALILSTIIFSGHLLRAEENPGLSNESKKKVAALVEKLKAEDFTERAEAADALKAMGRSIVPVLKELAPSQTDVEAASQIYSIIAFFAPLKAVVKDPVIKSIVSNRAAHNHIVILDGKPSVEANGGHELNYKWTQLEGRDLELPEGRLTKDRVGLLIFSPGKYRFKLIVSNGQKESEPAFVDVQVEEEKKEEVKEEKK